ncbi:MFS transporter [Vibrio mediterranei]
MNIAVLYKNSFSFNKIDFGLRINYFTMFLIDCVVSNYIPPLLMSRGYDAIDIANISSFRYAVVIFAPIMYAFLSDKFGRKRSLIVGSWLSGFTVVGLFVPFGFLAFAALYSAQQFLQQGTATQLDALSLRTLSDPSKYGRIRIFGNFGFISTSLLGAYIDANYGLDALLWYMLAAQLLLLITVNFLPSDVDLSTSTKKDSVKVELTKTEVKKPFRPSFDFVLAMIVVFLLLTSQGVINNYFVIYLKSLGYDANVGMMFTIGSLSVMGIFIWGQHILKHIKFSHIMFFCCAITAVRWLMQGYFTDSVYILYFTQTLHAFTYGLVQLAMMKFIANCIPREHIGKATGIYGSCGMGLGNIIGVQIAGYLWEYFTPQLAYTSMSAAAAVGALVALFIKANGFSKECEHA